MCACCNAVSQSASNARNQSTDLAALLAAKILSTVLLLLRVLGLIVQSTSLASFGWLRQTPFLGSVLCLLQHLDQSHSYGLNISRPIPVLFTVENDSAFLVDTRTKPRNESFFPCLRQGSTTGGRPSKCYFRVDLVYVLAARSAAARTKNLDLRGRNR